jgi:HK97 family phage major capsid protein
MSSNNAVTENKIASLVESKNKSLRSMSTLMIEGKETSPEYKALEASIAETERTISALRAIANSPTFRAHQEKQATEERNQQNRENVSATASAVTAGVASIIRSERQHRIDTNKAYRNFFLRGEVRDGIVTSSTSGEALIPQEFSAEFTETLKQISPVSQLVKQVQTDSYGRPVKNVIVSDVSNTMVYTAEGTATADIDPSVASSLHTPSQTDTLTTMVRASKELLSDAFDLISFLKETFAVRYARSLESAVLLAQDGATTVLPNSTTGGLIATASAGVTTGTLAAGVTYANLAALKASVDRAYSANPDACYLLSTGLYAALEAAEDSTGRPLYKHDAQGNLLVAGKVAYASNLLANVGTANGISALYGSFKESWISQTSQLAFRFLHERFADVNEIGYIGLGRVAGTSSVAVTGSVKALKLAAS